VNGTRDRPSVDFLDFRTGHRSTVVRLDKRYWLGMALSPDERSLIFPLMGTRQIELGGMRAPSS
jgi:hypothetical protein